MEFLRKPRDQFWQVPKSRDPHRRQLPGRPANLFPFSGTSQPGHSADTLMPPDTRFPGKLGEELSDHSPEDHAPGVDYRYTFVPGATISGTTVFTTPGSPGVPGDAPIGRHAFGQTLGIDGLVPGLGTLVTLPSSAATTSPPTTLKVDRSQETFTHSSVQGLSDQPILVAGSQQTFSGDESRNTTETHSYHRCLPYGLGSSPARLNGSGDMDTIRIPTQHQLARAQSYQIGSDALCTNFDTNTCLGPDGQYDGQGIRESTGGHPFPLPHGGGYPPVSMGRSSSVIAQGGTPGREGERDSRLVEQADLQRFGMANSSRGVQGPDPKVGVSSHGSLCIKIRCPTSEISDPIPNKRGRGDRCPTVPLASRSSVRLPSNPISTLSYKKNCPAKGRGSSNCTKLAKKTLVPRPHSTEQGTSVEAPGETRPSQSGADNASQATTVPVSCLEVEWHALSKKGYPSPIVDTMLSSKRSSTFKTYGATWKKFREWCSQHEVSPLKAKTLHILQFLQDGLEMGLSASSLQRQVAALNSTLGAYGGKVPSAHPHVKCFLKEVNNIRPLWFTDSLPGTYSWYGRG